MSAVKKKFSRYIFVLNCITYKKDGVFEVKLEDLPKIRLNPDIKRWGVPKEVDNLLKLLSCEAWDNWEDHAPFNFDDFYKYAKQIGYEESTFFVSE